MKLEKWTTIAEVVSAIAIVATLAILVVEVRENTNAIKASTVSNVTNGWFELNKVVVQDPEVARALVVGLYNPKALSDIETTQFSMFLRMFDNQVLRVRDLRNLGLAPDADYQTALQQLASFFDTPGGRLYLETAGYMPSDLRDGVAKYMGHEPVMELMLGRDKSSLK